MKHILQLQRKVSLKTVLNYVDNFKDIIKEDYGGLLF